MLLGCSYALYALDFPAFYRAPGFQTNPMPSTQDWLTTIRAQVRFGDTKKAYDAQEKTTGLFNTEGPFNMGQLISYEPDSSVTPNGLASARPQPVTGSAAEDYVNALIAITTPNPLSKNGAPFSFSGTFEERDFNFDICQNIMLGFYAGVYMPVRILQLTDITYSTTLAKADADPLISILETNLDPMLVEKGISPIKTPFNKTGIGDLLLYVGWQGRNNTKSDFTNYISGGVCLGALFPTAGEPDINRVFTLPLGYNGHYGAHARGTVELGFCKYFALGGNFGTTIFFNQMLTRRLKTDTAQNGWILLDKANVLEDLGHLWDVTGYLKAYFKYVCGVVGYSFCQQESTRLTIAARDNVSGLFKNEIINTDGRLTGWNHQTIHLLARGDLSAMTNLFCAPILELSYDVCWAGKHAFQTAMAGGTFGLALAWDF